MVRNPATGQLTCRVLLDPAVAAQYAGCQPLNVLNGNPAASTPAGYAYATGTSSYRATINLASATIASRQASTAPKSPAHPGRSRPSTSVPLAANMPPTPWHTAIFTSPTWAGAVPRTWRTLSWIANIPYMPVCV